MLEVVTAVLCHVVSCYRCIMSYCKLLPLYYVMLEVVTTVVCHAGSWYHCSIVVSCSMLEVSTVLQGGFLPPHPAHSRAVGDGQPIVRTLTSCVSLPYWLVVLLSSTAYCLTSYRYCSLTLSLTLSVHACFFRLLFLPCTHTPSLDAQLYLWYQDLWLVELLSAHQHMAPTPLRYLRWSLC